MQVQCDVCQATLELPLVDKVEPQLQCKCGTLVSVPTTSHVNDNDHALTVAQPFAFRLVGESPVSSEKEREETAQASPTPTLRFAAAPEEHEGEAAVAEAVATVSLAAQRPRSVAQSKTAASTTAPAAASRLQSSKRRPGAWRQCSEHPQAKSETMCPACAVGYCGECKKTICPTCDNPCIQASGYQKWLEQERIRARPMTAEIKTILSYPLQDPMAFIIFAMITGLFGFAALFSPRAIIFSWGILLWYSFHTLYQVASGNLTRFIPEFNDISDITHPLRLSGAALLITWGPLLLLGILFTVNVGMGLPSFMGETPVKEETVTVPSLEEDPMLAEVQSLLGAPEEKETGREDSVATSKPEEQEPHQTPIPTTKTEVTPSSETTTGVSLLLLLALLWKVAYTPVALIVAALSKNVMSVFNPSIGVDTIRRMGPVYWQVLLIYTGLTVTELGIGKIFGLMPIIGDIGMAFVKAYIAIAVGCALGLAVYKKAPALGWD